jgi:hypothetical protein
MLLIMIVILSGRTDFSKDQEQDQDQEQEWKHIRIAVGAALWNNEFRP